MCNVLYSEDRGLFTYPLNSIRHKTGIEIESNKRNGRKQRVHIDYMNNQRAWKVANGECQMGRPKGAKDLKPRKTGRPAIEQDNKRAIVEAWQLANPQGSKANCIKETGLSKPTVYKWWDIDKI